MISLAVLAVIAASDTPALAAEVPPGTVVDRVPATLLTFIRDHLEEVTAIGIVETAALYRLPADVQQLAVWCDLAPADLLARAHETLEQVIAEAAVPPLPDLGALELWRREVALGRRRAGEIDDLARAAMWEMSAREAHADGSYTTSERCHGRAIECLAAPRQAAA